MTSEIATPLDIRIGRVKRWQAFLLALWVTLGPLASTANETPRNCDFTAEGLSFTSRLIREKGTLIGYEMAVRNRSSKDLYLDHPELAHEAADVTIFEVPEPGGERLRIDEEFLYPMHGPVETQQKWYRGILKSNDQKIFKVFFKDALKNGNTLREGYIYDIRIRSVLYFRSAKDSYDAPRDEFEKIRNRINFGGCLSYLAVKLHSS